MQLFVVSGFEAGLIAPKDYTVARIVSRKTMLCRGISVDGFYRVYRVFPESLSTGK